MQTYKQTATSQTMPTPFRTFSELKELISVGEAHLFVNGLQIDYTLDGEAKRLSLNPPASAELLKFLGQIEDYAVCGGDVTVGIACETGAAAISTYMEWTEYVLEEDLTRTDFLNLVAHYEHLQELNEWAGSMLSIPELIVKIGGVK